MREHREELVLAAIVLEQFVGAAAFRIGKAAQARDVGHHQHEAVGLALLIDNRIGDNAVPAFAGPQFGRMTLECRRGGDVEDRIVDAEALEEHGPHRSAGDLLLRCPDQGEQGAVGAQDLSVGSQDGGRLGDRIEGALPLVTEVPEIGFRVLAAQDVACGLVVVGDHVRLTGHCLAWCPPLSHRSDTSHLSCVTSYISVVDVTRHLHHREQARCQFTDAAPPSSV